MIDRTQMRRLLPTIKFKTILAYHMLDVAEAVAENISCRLNDLSSRVHGDFSFWRPPVMFAEIGSSRN